MSTCCCSGITTISNGCCNKCGGVKMSGFSPASAVSSGDKFPVVRGSTNLLLSWSQLLSSISSYLGQTNVSKVITVDGVDHAADGTEDAIVLKTAQTVTLQSSASMKKIVRIAATTGTSVVDPGAETINGVAGPINVVAPSSVAICPYDGGFWIV